MNVVLHINDIEKFAMLDDNLKNLQAADFCERAVIVANDGAVEAYYGAEVTILMELYKGFARFKACRNSLEKQNLNPDRLPKGVEVVANGVIEIISKQAENYAYLKI